MALPEGIIEKYERITRYPLSQYLRDYVSFLNIHRKNILSYYSGSLNYVPEVSFNKLTELLRASKNIEELTDLHNNKLTDYASWELIDILSTAKISLETIENSSKWLRSSITKNNFNLFPESQYFLKKNQTLEKVSDELGSSNREKDWVNLAFRNKLVEEDYTPEGGNTLVVNSQGKRTISIRSVVDNIVGDRVYGIDFDQTITFDSDQEDLKVLSPKETFLQSAQILSSLKQGSTPEFPFQGIQGSLINGTNISSVPYSIIFRQYQNTFSQDDTFRSLAISKIETVSDALFIELEVEGRLGEVESMSINTSTL